MRCDACYGGGCPEMMVSRARSDERKIAAIRADYDEARFIVVEGCGESHGLLSSVERHLARRGSSAE